jgi:hypothetical protein
MQGKSVKHAHASYAHIILQMSLTHKVKFVPKTCTNANYLSLSPMGRERTPKKKGTSSLHATDFFGDVPKCLDVTSPLGFVHPY